MTQLQLFGEEATKMIQDIPKTKTTRNKKERELSVNDLFFEIHKKKEEIEKEKQKIMEYEVQDETGWDSTTLCIKGKDSNLPLCKAHISYYEKEIEEFKRRIEEKREPYTPMLTEWKQFILNYLKEKGQEVDVIWFNESSPVDCEIDVRLKGHKCWSSCVNFRFSKDKIDSYDSDFGHGTSFVENRIHQTHIDRQNLIRELLDKIIAKECEKCHIAFWKPDENRENRKIFVNEKGWIVNDWMD